MPFPLLAHQAPVLPLKAWWPARFSGTALVVGSVAPDLEHLAAPAKRDSGLSHSLAGQFAFCLPLTLAIVLYVGRLRVGDALAARLRVPLLGGAATGATGARGVLAAAVSALAGSFSHLALDAFTHRTIPRLARVHGPWRWHGMALDVVAIAQLTLSVAGAIVTVVVLRTLLRRAPPPPAPRPGGRALLAVTAAIGAAVGTWRALPMLREPNSYYQLGHIYVWGDLLFLVACSVAIAWLAAGGVLAWDDRRRGSGGAA